MVLHVLYQVTCIKIISNEIYLMCDALFDDCVPRSFCYFVFFQFFFFNFHFTFSLKLFLNCSYFSGDLILTVLIKCVLNKKESVDVTPSLAGYIKYNLQCVYNGVKNCLLGLMNKTLGLIFYSLDQVCFFFKLRFEFELMIRLISLTLSLPPTLSIVSSYPSSS